MRVSGSGRETSSGLCDNHIRLFYKIILSQDFTTQFMQINQKLFNK